MQSDNISQGRQYIQHHGATLGKEPGYKTKYLNKYIKIIEIKYKNCDLSFIRYMT